MRSDSELNIFSFRSEKRIGLLMQSDTANPTGQNLTRESDGPSRQNFAKI